MYFDTHAHYDDEKFDGDRYELLSSMPENGVELIVNAACDMKSSKTSISLAEKFPFLYASVGVHPHEAQNMDDNSISELQRLSAHEKVVAIGEVGLDYYYDFSPRDIQKQRFREQLELTRTVKLPAIIHERDACMDVLNIIRDFPDILGVYHCYSGSWDTAKTILDMGWYLSFTGVVTFKNAKKMPEVVSKIPADRIMIETDSPYLAPVPNRGQRNSSLNLEFIARKIAEIRGVSEEEIAALTLENGKRFFGIK